MMKMWIKTSIIAAALSVTACGGGAAPIVQSRVAMEKVHSTPLEERQGVIQAAEAFYAAQMAFKHAAFLVEDVEYEISLAEAEKDRNRAEQRAAEIEGKRNGKILKSKLQKAALALVDARKKDEGTIDNKISYLKARRSLLKKQYKQAEAKSLWEESRFELAKAKLADKRKVMPKGKKLDAFVKQEKRAADNYRKASDSTKSAQAKAQEKKTIWEKSSK